MLTQDSIASEDTLQERRQIRFQIRENYSNSLPVISLRTLLPSVKPLTSNDLIVFVSLKFFKGLHLT